MATDAATRLIPVMPTLRLRSLALALAGAALLSACRADSRQAAVPRLVLDSLPSPAGSGSSEPNVAVGGDGRVLLSWVEPTRDSLYALRYAEWRGGGWSAAETVTERSDIWLNWADFPSMAVLEGGTLAAHWPQRSGAGTYDYDVRIAHRHGGQWSEGVIAHPESHGGEHGFVSMLAAGDSTLAVWLDARGYDTTKAGATKAMGLAGRTLAPDGSLGADAMLDPRTCDCCQTDAAHTSRGPVVVYRDRTEDEIRDIYLVRRENGAWTAPTLVHADGWRVNYCPVNGPAVAARGERVVVAWFTAPQDSGRVHVAFSGDAGSRFAAPVRVDAGAPVGRVDVLMMEDGGAIVTWLERGEADTAYVMARVVSSDGAAGERVIVAASKAARASGFPRTALRGDSVLFAWTAAGAQKGESRVHTAVARIE